MSRDEKRETYYNQLLQENKDLLRTGLNVEEIHDRILEQLDERYER